jgi:hypothetical protein
MNIPITLRSLKAKILLSVILVVLVIEGLFLYLNTRPLTQQMINKTEEEASDWRSVTASFRATVGTSK